MVFPNSHQMGTAVASLLVRLPSLAS
jgi:hypothetical protein